MSGDDRQNSPSISRQNRPSATAKFHTPCAATYSSKKRLSKFSAMLKLQQRNAEAIENGAGSITTECKGFDFSITLGDDFKIATDKETQKEIIEIKLQGS